MQLEKRLKNHYRRWDIDFNYEEDFSKFKNRVVSAVDRLIGSYLTENPDVDNQFLEFFNLDEGSKPYVKKAQPVFKNPLQDVIKDFQPSSYTQEGFGDTNVYKCIDACRTLQKLATVLQILFWTLKV